MTVDDERQWWDTLRGPAVEINTEGDPPYDVEKVADWIVTTLQPREFHRWLDLGCGPGRLTRAVARRAPQVEITGVDISSNLLSLAKTSKEGTGTVRYRQCDGRTLPEQCGMFDGAYSVTMLQHIPLAAQRGYIAEVASRLHKGSTFFFTVAIGTVDEFLSHQISDRQLREWLFKVGLRRDALWEWSGWHWVEAVKQ